MTIRTASVPDYGEFASFVRFGWYDEKRWRKIFLEKAKFSILLLMAGALSNYMMPDKVGCNRNDRLACNNANRGGAG
jgi:hypothetical protein